MTSAEIAATATAAAIATTATTVATTTATAVTTAVTALFATEATTVATVFATCLFAAGGWYKDGLGRDTEQSRELALQRSPETNRCLHGDDDGFNLDTRAIFATRTVTFRTRTVFATRAVTFRTRTITFGTGAGTFGTWFTRFAARARGTFGARFTGFAALTVARDTRLAAFFDSGAFRTVFTTGTLFAARAVAFGSRFATFARRLVLSRLLREFAREVLGDFSRIRDHADGRASVLGLAARGDVLRDATTTELLRRDDGARFSGGFAGGANHGKGRKLRVSGFQLGFGDTRRRGGGGRVLFRRRGGGVGGRVVLPGVFLAHGFSWCGDRMFGRLVKAVSAVVAERPGLR
ncbi:MAG: hypothetical protein RL759_23 [Verrucomicrobiota bacterium]